MPFSNLVSFPANESDKVVAIINKLRQGSGLPPLVHSKLLKKILLRGWGREDFYLNLKTHRTERCVISLTWEQAVSFVVEHHPQAAALIPANQTQVTAQGVPLALSERESEPEASNEPDPELAQELQDLREEVSRLKSEVRQQKASSKTLDSGELSRLQSFEKHMAKHLPELNSTHEARIVELKARHLEQLQALKDQLASKSKQIAQLVCGLSPT